MHMTCHAKPFARSDPFWRGDRDALRVEEGNEVFAAITSLGLAARSAQ
jgi:hypothetical protein